LDGLRVKYQLSYHILLIDVKSIAKLVCNVQICKVYTIFKCYLILFLFFNNNLSYNSGKGGMIKCLYWGVDVNI
jgi:hypothetical protein